MTSIRTRLLFWLMLPLAAIVAIVSIETFYHARRISNDLHDRTLLTAMLTISENVVNSNGTLLAEDTLNMLTRNLGERYFYYVVGPNGSFVTGYSAHPKLPKGVALKYREPYFYDGQHQGRQVRVVVMQQMLIGRELNGITTITAWRRVSPLTDLTLQIFMRSLTRLVLLVVAAGTIVWFAVRRGLRPLHQLQDAIENRTPYDLTPIRRPLPLELKGIVHSMNFLFARVARSKSNREQFIGNAAHQLCRAIGCCVTSIAVGDA